MGHKTVFRCAVPQPSTLSKYCHLIYTLWLSLMAAPSLQTRRYSSMARIHSMTIEAPITKVSPEQTFPQTPVWSCTHMSFLNREAEVPCTLYLTE